MCHNFLTYQLGLNILFSFYSQIHDCCNQLRSIRSGFKFDRWKYDNFEALQQGQEPVKISLFGQFCSILTGKDKDGNVSPSVVAYWFAWGYFNLNTAKYT